MDDSSGSEVPPSAVGPLGAGWRPSESKGNAVPSVRGDRRAAEQGPEPGVGQRGGVAGQVRALQQRTERSAQGEETQVVAFRLERFDAAGNRLAPVPVEMRGRSFSGSMTDGDWVQVAGHVRDGTLHARKVSNLTTGALVRTRSAKLVRVLVIIAALVIILIMIIIAINFFHFTDVLPRPINRRLMAIP